MPENEYENHQEKPEYVEKLKDVYQKKKLILEIIMLACACLLLVSSLGQFALLDRAFETRFNIIGDRVFKIEIKTLLSLLITGALPITSIIDESGFLGKKSQVPLPLNIKLYTIWLIFLGDFSLTFQAIYINPQGGNASLAAIVSFITAAIFSITALFLSRVIVATFKKFMLARKHLQILKIYGINPIPFYKDAEQIKLGEEMKVARAEALEAKQTLEEENSRYQEELESQRVEYEQRIQSQESEYYQERQKLEDQIFDYREHLDAVSELKKNFNKIKKPIVDLVSQGKGMFDRLSHLDESIKGLDFPKLAVDSAGNGEVVEKPTYYWMLQNDDDSRENLRLPSKPSPAGSILLQAIQHQQLPRPEIRSYAPRENLAKCLVLNFADYGVVVYCRDEEFNPEGEQWRERDELNFKAKLSEQQSSEGICTLHFTTQEIMSNPPGILEQIKNALHYRRERGEE